MLDPRPVILLDLNGTVHRYTSGWNKSGPLYDPPTDGFRRWAESVIPHFRLLIWPTHMNSPREIRLIKKWLKKHGLDDLGLEVVSEPPRGLKLKIDDRALNFSGNWDDYPLEKLQSFRTWSGR